MEKEGDVSEVSESESDSMVIIFRSLKVDDIMEVKFDNEQGKIIWSINDE